MSEELARLNEIPVKQRSRYGDGVGNLPAQPTAFIGRTDEVAEIIRLLADPACRLLTLAGLGGMGKTRLAIQAAKQKQADFAHGVYFVPLQPVRSIDFLVSAMADALDLTLSGPAEPQEQLLSYLHDKKMLLLLDNFEQFLTQGGAELLAHILSQAPKLKLLVTSREALNLQGEWFYPVQGLPFPPSAQTDDAETYDAVQLFVECARRVRQDFSLAKEQAGVVRICQLVEGLPLALEIAASWTKTLRCEVIAAEIEHNLAFLATSWRNIPDRHQNIQAVFNQTWELLTSEERDVFKRLSVFRDGFWRQAAERVAGASFMTLSALVDKSLLRRESNGRYQVHELLRQYAEKQLQESPEEATRVEDLHCTYYADFLHTRMEGMLGDKQGQASAEIEADLENVRQAWQYAVNQVKVDALYKAAQTLSLFFQFQSRYREAADAFENATQTLSSREPTAQTNLTLARLLVTQSWFCIRLGRLEKAKGLLEWSQDLYGRLNAPPAPGYATDPAIPLAIIASIRGNYAEVARLGQKARQVSEANHHQWNRSFSYYVLARAALAQGQYQTAQQYAQQAYTQTKETGDRWFMAYCLNELGNIARALGDYAEAEQHYQDSYALRKKFDDPEGMAVALNHLGEVAINQQNYSEANRLYRRSLTIYEQISDRGGLATSLSGLGRIACALGDYQAAQQYFRQALQVATNIRFLSLALSLIVSIADLLFRTGPSEQALELLGLAQQHPASDHETKERVQHLLTRYEAELPPDEFTASIRRGAESELEAVLTTLQNELSSPQKQPGTVPAMPAADLSEAPQPLIDPLTSRQLEVLRLMAEGLSNREIAQELVIAQGTVKTHVHNICRKLGVRNRTQAATRARELHLL